MTANRVILDEMAYYTTKICRITLQEVLDSVTPTIERTGGQILGISTANGRNAFSELYLNAEGGKSKYKSFFISCYDVPGFTKEVRERMINTHPLGPIKGLAHVNQEHPDTPEVAFLHSGRPRFDQASLKLYREEKLIAPIFVGEIYEDTTKVLPNIAGNFRIFKKYSKYKQYLLVSDVAEGLEHGDYSCLKVFERDTLEQVAEWHGHIEHALFGSVNVIIAKMYNNAIIVIESNNHGHASLTRVRDVEHYPEPLIFIHDVLSQEKPDDSYKNPIKRMGWRTTVQSKKAIINNLAYVILKTIIPGLTREDIKELYNYIRVGNKTEAEKNCFDDRVMVLAIAYYLLTLEVFDEQYPVLIRPDWQMCKNCNNWQKEGMDALEGECRAVGGVCKKSDDWCILWLQYRWA
jgi:hypothetical protein